MSSPLHNSFSTDISPVLHAAPDKGAGAAARASQPKGTQSHGQGTHETGEGQDDSGRGLRSGPAGENQNAEEARQEVRIVKPTHERFTPSMPTVNALVQSQPVPQLSPELPKVCGTCPAWYRPHSQAPFGQCTAAIRWLGAPLYTTDLGMCTLTEAQRHKEARR